VQYTFWILFVRHLADLNYIKGFVEWISFRSLLEGDVLTVSSRRRIRPLAEDDRAIASDCTMNILKNKGLLYFVIRLVTKDVDNFVLHVLAVGIYY